MTMLFLFLFTITWLRGRLFFMHNLNLKVAIDLTKSASYADSPPTSTIPYPSAFYLCLKKKKKILKTRSTNIGRKYSHTRVFRRLRGLEKISKFCDVFTHWTFIIYVFPSFLFLSNRDCPVKNYQIHHLQFQQITSVSSKIPFDWP